MAIDPTVLIPASAALIGGLICLGSEPFLSTARKHLILPWIAALFLAVGVASSVVIALSGHGGDISGIYLLDASRAWLSAVIMLATLIGVAGMQVSLARDAFSGGEPYALAMFAAVGATLMAMAGDSLALFIGIEIASLSIYALVGLRRHRRESNEALYKYFVMGAVFSAIYLYGTALTYGATGSTHFGAAILTDRSHLWQLGHALMLIGLLFKIGAVPFHFWAPDAYTGAPVAVTGLMGAIVKVGGFAALGTMWLAMCQVANGGTGIPAFGAALTISDAAGETLKPFSTVVLILAVLSIAVGNLSALAQTSVRRVVAFSSVAHAGYMLLALVLPLHGQAISFAALTVYLIAYAVATAGALTVVAALSGADDAHDDLTSLAGQGRTSPLHGVALTVCMAAAAGLPPTLGFIAKFGVLADLVGRHYVMWAIPVAILSVVGAVYYLRLIVAFWVAEPQPRAAPSHAVPTVLVGMVIAIAAIVLIATMARPDLFTGLTPIAAQP